MIAALDAMKAHPLPPVLFANHPSRSAPEAGKYGRYDPAEFRDWNDAAPNVAVGMEGAPGHQAGAINPDGSLDPEGRRGGYRKVPTMGGFDPMTARLGGLWDSMLSEGRRWWVTATSDSHRHWREGGSDFWPGEYSKTYVLARRDHTDIVDGLRHKILYPKLPRQFHPCSKSKIRLKFHPNGIGYRLFRYSVRHNRHCRWRIYVAVCRVSSAHACRNPKHLTI